MNNLFQKETEQLNIINNTKNIIMSILYKLKNDKNVSYFLENLIYHCSNYENLEHMEKYYFEKELEEMNKILSLYIYSLKRNYPTKDCTAEEIIEPCIILNDYYGLSLMRIIGYYPLIKIMQEKVKYLSTIKNHLKQEDLEFYQSEQQKKLFSGSKFYPTFPENKSFTNYELQNKHIEKIKEEYETKKDDIQFAINTIIENMDVEPEHIKEQLIKLGCLYWDKQQEVDKAKQEQFSAIFKTLITTISKEE